MSNSILCKCGIHNWDQVKDTTYSHMLNDSFLGIFFPVKEVGKRTCKRCKKEEIVERIHKEINPNKWTKR